MENFKEKMQKSGMDTCNRWGIYEVALDGPKEGNPFTEQRVTGTFHSINETVSCDGFYDGDGIYRIRFMPSFEGEYTYQIQTTFGKNCDGHFMVTKPKKGAHGPVRVANTYHMAYEDGTPYYSIGTTCYVWELQSDELIEQTFDTLKNNAFNKIRFCIFPKHYDYNLREPRSYPYEGTPMDSSILTTENFGDYTGKTKGNHWDFTRFNPKHFQHIENCIHRLGELGIEADLIMMHPYDRWGFSHMSAEQDDLYWRYVIARFAAFRNVWWSLANEYDILADKTIADWERYAQILVDEDPYRHLRSVHNCLTMYDYTRPWITHCSIQRTDLYKCAEYTDDYRTRYGKPVVLDEIAYEGDIDQGWGNISGQELVRRFWEAALRGGYATHGETFDRGDNVLWWSHGGKLHGESPARIRFLRQILEQTPGAGLRRMNGQWDELAATVDTMGDSGYYLYYYGFLRPSRRTFSFPENVKLEAEIIDTWNMTVTPAGTHTGRFTLELPRREYMAVRLRRV